MKTQEKLTSPEPGFLAAYTAVKGAAGHVLCAKLFLAAYTAVKNLGIYAPQSQIFLAAYTAVKT